MNSQLKDRIESSLVSQLKKGFFDNLGYMDFLCMWIGILQ
jgi:hypothetical protein